MATARNTGFIPNFQGGTAPPKVTKDRRAPDTEEHRVSITLVPFAGQKKSNQILQDSSIQIQTSMKNSNEKTNKKISDLLFVVGLFFLVKTLL